MDTQSFHSTDSINMRNLIERFWKWSQMTPQEYASVGIDLSSDKAEFHFPLFDELLDSAKKAMCKNHLTDQEIDDVLTIMALDNEVEDILTYLETISNCDLLDSIIKAGIHHQQPHARWQIAELIYRVKHARRIEYLEILSKDQNSYVRKRANNCLENLDIIK